jgi:outer membrane lipoprotein-sorting protein
MSSSTSPASPATPTATASRSTAPCLRAPAGRWSPRRLATRFEFGAHPDLLVDLTPQKPNGDIQKIRIMIDKQKMFIKGANMEGKDGNKYIISVQQFKTDGVYADKDFVFDPKKYKDIEVVDMR